MLIVRRIYHYVFVMLEALFNHTNLYFQHCHVHLGWCFNNVVHYVLKHVIILVKHVRVGVLMAVFVLLDKYYLMGNAWNHFVVQVEI